MPKKEDRSECHPKLREEVRSLIDRKLKNLRQEWDRRWVDKSTPIFSKLHKEMLEHITNRRLGWALNEVPLSVYRELVASTRATTKEWPGLVWGKIKSTLEKVQAGPVDSKEINAIVDDHAWDIIGQHPFTIRHIDSTSFLGTVYREARRAGVGSQNSPSLKQALASKEAAAQCGLITTARHERKRISIAIDEYVISQCQNPHRQHVSPHENRRHLKKDGNRISKSTLATSQGGRPQGHLSQAVTEAFRYFSKTEETEVVRKGNCLAFIKAMKHYIDHEESNDKPLEFQKLAKYLAERIKEIKIHQNKQCSITTYEKRKGYKILEQEKKYNKNDVSKLLSILRKKISNS